MQELSAEHNNAPGGGGRRNQFKYSLLRIKVNLTYQVGLVAKCVFRNGNTCVYPGIWFA